MATRTGSTTRERLSRDTITSGALELADREGLDAVTIRRLATDNSVTPMALYWHFADKDAVLDGIAERVFASVVLPAPTTESWDVQLRAALMAVLRAVRPHPLVADILAPRVMKSEAGLVLAERVIGMLRTAGFGAEAASQTAAFLLCSIVTLVTSEPGNAEPGDVDAKDEQLRAKKAQLDSLDPKRFPSLIESAQFFLYCDDEEDYFRRGIDFLVKGTIGVLSS
ncbi:MAG TPA: TetR/AcrR family transcriptional regulator C-terminal domain-containing protein [Galbitalea sp.]|jgi:AcrR family transcriptional regulator|nr:TetR/AcrR family transcriptional regulator C-terminal domain-containing protein [Galbitalea sp.]